MLGLGLTTYDLRPCLICGLWCVCGGGGGGGGYSTSCCDGDSPSVKVDTQTLYNTMHQCGATILIIEAVSPPRLALGTITSTLALQRKRYWSKRFSSNNCRDKGFFTTVGRRFKQGRFM